METGLTGAIGLSAQLHASQEMKPGPDFVTVQPLHMVVIPVLGQKQKRNHVLLVLHAQVYI